MRRDAWWAQPLGTFLILGAFVVYATWAAFQGNHYEYGPYLSPFYSPLLFGEGPHSWFGPVPGWWPGAIPFSAALLILWAPGGFRFTCYYYRGAYYKAFWADPPSCTVGEPRKKYRGENSFPLDPPERPSLLPVSRSALPDLPVERRLEGAVVRRSGHRRGDVRDRRRERWCSPRIRRFSAATHSGATRSAIWSAGGSIGSPRIRLRRSCTTQPANSTANTTAGRGRACSPSRSPISTCASARWAS